MSYRRDRERFRYEADRRLPRIPEPHGKHDVAIGATVVFGAAAVAIGFWIRRQMRTAREASAAAQAPIASNQEQPK